jgi:hypothetical protein
MISGSSEGNIKKLQTSKIDNDNFSLKINFSKNKKTDSTKLNQYDRNAGVNSKRYSSLL